MGEMIFEDIFTMFRVSGIACTIVFIAMIIDLGSGLYKAKLRGEIRSSWGLKRSLTKFITYEGSMIIAMGVDVLLYFCKLFQLFHLDVMVGVPIVSCIMGIFLLVIEFISVKEAADEKTKTEMARVAQAASDYITKKDLKELLTEILKQNSNENPS